MPKDTLTDHSQDLSTSAFTAFREWFAKDEIVSLIHEAAYETGVWLRENERSISADGRQVVEPWFDTAAFSAALPNEMAEGERHYTLEIKAYEHGIGDMLRRLQKKDVLDIEYEKCAELVFLRSGEVNAWLRYLVRNSWVDRSINLKAFCDTGDFRPSTPQAHAKAKLEQAAALGVATVDQPSGARSYSITAGPVAKVFYEDVWYPVVKSLRPQIEKWSES